MSVFLTDPLKKGIWDVLTSQAAVNLVRYLIASGVPLHEVAECVLDRCIALNPDVYELTQGGGAGCDNMTVMVVALLRGRTMQQWQQTVAARWAALEKPPVVDTKPPQPEVTKTGFLCCTYETVEPGPAYGRARGDRPPPSAVAPQPQMHAPAPKGEAAGMELAIFDELHLDSKEIEALLKRPMTLNDLNLTFFDIEHKFPVFE